MSHLSAIFAVVTKNTWSVLTAALLPQVTQAGDAPLFAAPAAGHASSATSSGSIGQVSIALAVVLALVFFAAWALRGLRKFDLSANAQHMQVVAQVALGAKERAVLIRVKDIQVLVGVAPGQVTALHTFTMPMDGGAQTTANAEATSPALKSPSFQAILKKSLGWS